MCIRTFGRRRRNMSKQGGFLYASLNGNSAIPQMAGLFGARMKDDAPVKEVTLKIIAPFGGLQWVIRFITPCIGQPRSMASYSGYHRRHSNCCRPGWSAGFGSKSIRQREDPALCLSPRNVFGREAFGFRNKRRDIPYLSGISRLDWPEDHVPKRSITCRSIIP